MAPARRLKDEAGLISNARAKRQLSPTTDRTDAVIARIPRRRHRHPCRHPREDRREDVGVIVGVGVVECGLISGRENVT